MRVCVCAFYLRVCLCEFGFFLVSIRVAIFCSRDYGVASVGRID